MTARNAPGSIWLHRFAVLTAGATFLLIIAGALVVGHEAGLAFADWPLSDGTLLPSMHGGKFYEHGHRIIAGLVATLMAVQFIWLWAAERRRWVRFVAMAALLAVIAQAVLGGITVLYRLPAPVVIGHAFLAQFFFCMTVSLAMFTSPAWKSPVWVVEDDNFPSFRHLAMGTTAAIFIQLILGAARRHKALGLTPHLAWAGILTGLILWLIYAALNKLAASQRTLRLLSLAAGIVLALQLALGYGSYSTRLAAQGAPQPQAAVIYSTTAHVAVGALLLAVSLMITLLSYRNLAAPGTALSFEPRAQKTMA